MIKCSDEMNVTTSGLSFASSNSERSYGINALTILDVHYIPPGYLEITYPQTCKCVYWQLASMNSHTAQEEVDGQLESGRSRNRASTKMSISVNLF